MAATKRNAMLIEETRSRIQTSQLINRLQDHGFGKIELTDSQIKSIGILLKKSMPDLQAITHSGDPNNPIEVNVTARKAAAKAVLDEAFGEKPE